MRARGEWRDGRPLGDMMEDACRRYPAFSIFRQTEPNGTLPAPEKMIGRISYSFYLLHGVIIHTSK